MEKSQIIKEIFESMVKPMTRQLRVNGVMVIDYGEDYIDFFYRGCDIRIQFKSQPERKQIKKTDPDKSKKLKIRRND